MMRWLARLASLRLTSAALVLLALCVIGNQIALSIARDWMALPLAILAANLAAALHFNAAIRRSAALIVFHIGLLLLCLLAAANTLTQLEGRVELAEGQAFDWADVKIQGQGLWSPAQRNGVAFEQGPLDVWFAPGSIRQETRSQIGLRSADGTTTRYIVSDQTPLNSNGYRLSATSNKGFALMLRWEADDGTTQTGTVNLPSYPAMEWKQEQVWRTPAGESISLALSAPRTAQADTRWSMRSLLPAVTVQLHTDVATHTLRAGDPVRLTGGALRLLDVRLWMGYRVDYQLLLPLMLACALMCIAALSVHVLRRYFPDQVEKYGAPSATANAHHG